MRVELENPEGLIENEIARGLYQRDVAQSYALAMQTFSRAVDWERINKAIIARWSKAGLVRIKEAAWSGKWRGGPLFEGGDR